MKVLLHADLGSGVPPETAAKLLDCVDLTNLSGDEETMRRLATEAAARGVQIGASPGLSAVGATDISPQELSDLMSNQITALERVLAGTEAQLGHVKLRGSLARWCDERTDLAESCVDWMELEREGVPLIVRAGGLLHAVAEARGVPLLRAIEADRAYADEARLVPPGQPGATIDDPAEAARRIADWKRTGYLALSDGRRWMVEAETIGVSADSPRSVEVACAVREVLEEREKS